MNEESIDSELCEIVSLVLGRPVSLATNRTDTPEWDSLKHMEIIFSVEGRWGITFTEDEMVAVKTALDLKKRLMQIQ